MTTDWAGLLLLSFGTLESLEALEARSMVDVSTTRDSLFIKLEILEADRAWLIVSRTFKEFCFDLLPLCVASGLRWFFNKPKSFCETQFVDVLHPFLLDIIVSTLLSLLAHHQYLLYITTAFLCLDLIDHRNLLMLNLWLGWHLRLVADSRIAPCIHIHHVVSSGL